MGYIYITRISIVIYEDERCIKFIFCSKRNIENEKIQANDKIAQVNDETANNTRKQKTY